MIKTEFMFFLEDRTSYFDQIGTRVYLKVPYNQNLVLLYGGDKFSMEHNSMDYIGIYSYNMRDFLATSSAYSSIKVCDDFKEKTVEMLEIELDEKVQTELLTILQSLVTVSPTISETVLELAKDYKMRGEEPVFSFHDYDGKTISLENIEEFYADKDEYAYNIAESLINENQQCIREYQEYIDIIKTLSDLNQNMPIDMELEMHIKEIKEAQYQNIRIQLQSNKGLENRTIKVSEITNYPVYAIVTVHWGKKLLFDIKNFDAVKVEELKISKDYNLKVLSNLIGYRTEEVWNYIDVRNYDNYDFCMVICRKYPLKYGYIAEKFRRNISFIKNSNVSTQQLFEKTPEDVILSNKQYFLDLLRTSGCYSYLPKNAREDVDFVCAYIEKNGNDAIYSLGEKFFAFDKVQKAFDNWFLTNPMNLNGSSWYNANDIKISLLKNEDTKIFALKVGYLKALSAQDINNKHLILGFLERIQKFQNQVKMSVEQFVSFYNALDVLKTDEDIFNKLLELSTIDVSCWKVIDDSLKTKDLQRTFVQQNPESLSLMDDDIKMEFVYDNPKEYLQYVNPVRITSYSMRGRSFPQKHQPDVDEALLLDLISKKDDLSFIEKLNYTQKSDKKLIRKMMKVKKGGYKYIDSSERNELEFAEMAVKEFSVIPFLPPKTKYSTSLFNNRKIMEESLKHSPSDFYNIPQASRQSGPSPLLADKDFVMFAVKLDSYNANYIDPKTGLLEDEDICYEATMDDLDTIKAFAPKLFRNETFVYRICEGLKAKVAGMKSDSIKEIWCEEVKSKLMTLVPKKIKNTKEFGSQFAEFL